MGITRLASYFAPAYDRSVERYCEDLKEEIQYLIERLPEGGEGMYGIDDGEGDD